MPEVLGFFGAFNPPTVAHIGLAEYAMHKTGREGVVFVPSKSVYIRDSQGKDFAYSDVQRLEMLREIAKTRPWMQVDDLEMRAEKQPRTYESLCALREKGIHAALLMGSDKLPELEKGWLHVREICEEFGIVCMTRGKDACYEMIQGGPFLRSLSRYIQILETPQLHRNVSSSTVRRMLRDPDVRPEDLPVLPEIRHMVIEGAMQGMNT